MRLVDFEDSFLQINGSTGLTTKKVYKKKAEAMKKENLGSLIDGTQITAELLTRRWKSIKADATEYVEANNKSGNGTPVANPSLKDLPHDIFQKLIGRDDIAPTKGMYCSTFAPLLQIACTSL
eukprot:gb/GECG01002337.1/.p1 GENE.gb/GECG01002337.1/~~gb/GECG01002337.1/.p1  ORF type:complete len:123 (+),score=14.87 gb/GECG01002337.1/:1-369(+)